IDIAATKAGHVVRQQLQGNYGYQRLQVIRNLRQGNHFVGTVGDVVVSLARHGDHGSASGLDFFQIAHDLVAQGPARRSEGDRRRLLIYERDRPVFHLACRIALRVNVTDLLEFQGSLEGYRIQILPSKVENVVSTLVSLSDPANLGFACQGLAEYLG